jgi:hypothetical protein
MPSISIPAAIAIGGGLSAVGGIASAAIGSNAAQSAAKTQANAAQSAEQTQLQMFNTVQQNLAPYNQAGQGALSQLANIFGFGPGGTGQPNAAAATSQLTNFPGYQFGLNQGVQALDRSAASRGLLLSGAQLKDAQTYGQGYAQQQAWAPYVSELSSVAGLGENAGAGVGNAAVQTGSGVASSQLAAGQATAAGQVSSANQLTSGLSGLFGSGSGSISNLLSSYGGLGGATTSIGPGGNPATAAITVGGAVPSDLAGLT